MAGGLLKVKRFPHSDRRFQLLDSASRNQISLGDSVASDTISTRAMNPPAEKQNPHLMRRMFGRIAPRYDFVTRALSCGMDRRWKRDAVLRASLAENSRVLDLACGTGDFSRLVAQHSGGAKSIAADLTLPMLEQARLRGQDSVVCADASRLPFPDAFFDCVFVGYGLRNFPQLESCVREICRVTARGGKIISLDFFLPENRAFRAVYLGWLFVQGAFWGLMLHGRPRTYTYISHSLRSFVSLDGLSSIFRRCGYGHVQTRAYVFGGIGLHCAEKI